MKRFSRLALLALALLLWGCGGQQPPAVSTPEPTADARPANTTVLPQSLLALSQGSLVLVDGTHGFVPDSVETVCVFDEKTTSYCVKNTELALQQTAVEALNRWMDDARSQSGLDSVNVVAGFRTLAQQQELYDNSCETHGEDYARQYFQLPGFSEHHTGLAVDLSIYDSASGLTYDFTDEGICRWAAEHAWEYGFVLRYPQDKEAVTGISGESWHYRYVGLPHAAVMHQQALCLEEYLDLLRQHPWEDDHLTTRCGETGYEMYFCPGYAVTVPTDRPYTISGNNADGFIVAVELP